MGRVFAEDLAGLTSLEQGISIHLSSNFYPPIPQEMVQTCIDAINSYLNYEDDEILIQLPKVNDFQITWRGQDTAPIWSIIEQHRLWPWINNLDEAS